MKKIFALLTAAVILSFSFIPVLAENVKCDENKSSFECYAGQGNLKCTSEDIFSFDDTDKIYSGYNYISDGTNKKEGLASVSFSFDNNEKQAVVFSTKEGAFDFGITDPLKQTVKMWVYVNDVDLIECDHDSVHDKPQKNCGTFWIEFTEDSYDDYKYKIQHTFQGSGWHLLEIAFNTDNVLYKTKINMDITKLKWMRVRANVKSGLELKFDSLKKYTYSNDGYVQPECPNNGRWVSTCDFDALDGPIVTEWLGSSFDTEEKTQGSSSVTITGHKEHEDFRCVWGGLNFPLHRDTDVFHMDVYVSDIESMSNRFEMRLSQFEAGEEGKAVYGINYTLLNSCANKGEGLKTGWNSINIPIVATSNNIDTDYYTGAFQFVLDRITIFWDGVSEDVEYILKYDNIYVYSSNAFGSDEPLVDNLKPKQNTEESSKTGLSGVVIAAIVLSAAAVIVVILVVVLVIVKKKKSSGKEASDKK